MFFTVLALGSAHAQYYIRGEIKDEKSQALANVKLKFHSTGYIFYSGTYGGFGITTTNLTDSVTLSLDGYYSQTVLFDSRKENIFKLKLLSPQTSKREKRLMSVTRDLDTKESINTLVGGESYSSLRENTFMNAHRFPQTDFAINTDKASYSNIRRFLNMGTTVPHDAVRIEEMLNYFDLHYETPSDDQIFRVDSKLSSCPWRTGNQLLFIKASAKKVDLAKIPPSNLVFLIDVSGSMDMPNRLPLLKSAFKLMVNNLRPIDTVAIVIYGGSVGIWLNPTSGAEKEKINRAIEELEPGGATAGESGIRVAYRLAQSKFLANGNNRVILATDGDFNVGQTSEEDLEILITKQRQKGIYLTCLGVGMGNYKDSKLEVLAKKGNGNFAYLDDEKEAEKVLVKELTQTMYAVADDAIMNIRFTNDAIKSYRLIGFDNKYSDGVDTSNLLEGGEIGTGHTMMAIFEIEPDSMIMTTPGKLAEITLSYKRPKDSVKLEKFYTASNNFTRFDSLPSEYRFAAGLALFGSLLKESKFTRQSDWNQVQTIVEMNMQKDDFGRKDFLALLEKAKKVYYKGGKRSKSRGNSLR